MKELNFLLYEVCTELGFCNRLTAVELLPAGAVLTEADFVGAILRAEGINPEYEKKWAQQIGERFAKKFGASVRR